MFTTINHFKVQKLASLMFFSGITLAAQLFIALPAHAECKYEGQSYQTGETVGPYICMPNGSWNQQ